ncbi:hypothetical protein LA983_002700 [Vibrio fluvialis]|nr:hypothetical protein [Vibrio fluvialis]
MAPSAVPIHVPDVQAGFAWYQKAFTQATPVFLDEFDFTVLDMQGFSIEIVQADEKVAAGYELTFSAQHTNPTALTTKNKLVLSFPPSLTPSTETTMKLIPLLKQPRIH